MSQLPSSEAHGHFDFESLLQELSDMLGLEAEIVFLDFGLHADFLELDLLLLFLCFPQPFFLLELIFPVV